MTGYRIPSAWKEAMVLWVITFWCSCRICTFGLLLTASGVPPVEGRTVACPPQLPLGTVLLVEGIGELVCEDRGGAVRGRHLDVYVSSHEEALRLGAWHGVKVTVRK